PLNYIDNTEASDLFVVYESKDVRIDPNLVCGVRETAERLNTLNRPSAGTNCVRTELAIASDASMYTRYGSVYDVQVHNIGVMNNVIWSYVNGQFNDNIEFVIVAQNISTATVADQLSPAYTGTNSNTILSNFRTWGQAGGFGVSYDLAQFWTTRNIDNDGAGGSAGIIGLAYVGAVCTNSRYHILEDYTGNNPTGSGYQLRVLTTHEIGHNFNCSHDAAGSGFIMAPSVGNTSTWSPASVASVDAYVPGRACLAACSAAGVPQTDFISSPEAVCTGFSLQLQDRTMGGPSSWAWTMAGGTPASSVLRNPTVSFGTTGVKTISLTASNVNGAGATVSKDVLVSNAPAIACVNSGSSTSDAGIRAFSLNNINRISGSATVDGNKYMDFSCSDASSLLAGTLYTATVNVGYLSPSNPTPPHIFNHILFYIDYNNDGDFTDAGETVYSSGGSAYAGNRTFSFTTPASPPVSNQFLRARIIARDFGGSLSSCHDPLAGQVEDYSVFFISGVSLPVSLLGFEGYHSNGSNYLNWQTAEEIDHSHFEVERSLDGIQFQVVGRVNGRNNSSTLQRYDFTDPLNGAAGHNRYYYRLRIVDLSGAIEYSKVVMISTDPGQTNWVISVYPNPFRDQISAGIRLESPTVIRMQLIDLAGRVVYHENRSLPAGIHTLGFNKLPALSKGTYIIKLTGPGETYSRLLEFQK
ncbi:MAG TPA: M12 family metallo-peptidase, partial [Chitinophagaceae bacterium]|nr:M12 family metallo-peptidase [Chitinophagaceae bacterium]